MTKVNQEMIQYLAKLSRIAVSEDEKEALLTDLSKIVHYFEQLAQVDTSEVAPCTHLTPHAHTTPVRDDVVIETLSSVDFLNLVPAKTGSLVRVPQVLKQE
jgi:aspartyl-tRNA(Asn)/glutamyl-tRNA(Gln) amidotransferase subunit C